MSDFDRAKNLLIGAVDTVLSLATQANPTVRTPSTREGQAGSSSGRSQSTTCTSKRPAVPVKSEEHRRLFGYKPTKGKRPKKAASTTRRKGCGACRFVPKETTVLLNGSTFNRNSRPFGGTRGRLRPT